MDLNGKISIFDGQTDGSTASGSVIHGEASASGKGPFGVDTSVEANADYLSGEAGFDAGLGNSSSDIAHINAGAEGSVLSGGVSGEYGYVSGGASVSAISGEAKVEGKVQVTGEAGEGFTPGASLEASASADGIKAESDMQVGTDDYNVHSDGEISLGHAEAKAGIGAGFITYDDENGDMKKGFGVKAEAGAEAYAVQGRISHGFTIMGIDIDVGAEGKYGGAGAKAGGHLTAGSFGCSLDLGLAIGLGLDINIDWSDFHFPWESETVVSPVTPNRVSPIIKGRTDFLVKPWELRQNVSTMESMAKQIMSIAAELEDVQGNLQIDDVAIVLLKAKLAAIMQALNSEAQKMNSMAECIDNVSQLYSETESAVASYANN